MLQASDSGVVISLCLFYSQGLWEKGWRPKGGKGRNEEMKTDIFWKVRFCRVLLFQVSSFRPALSDRRIQTHHHRDDWLRKTISVISLLHLQKIADVHHNTLKCMSFHVSMSLQSQQHDSILKNNIHALYFDVLAYKHWATTSYMCKNQSKGSSFHRPHICNALIMLYIYIYTHTHTHTQWIFLKL